jgi:hypothetical protein
MLATGASTAVRKCTRREGGMLNEVCAPKLVRDYHANMGGVDIHDQVRLQRYSLQLSVKFKKYYKSLFLGLLDTAITNAFIVHKVVLKAQKKKHMSHVKFLKTLHTQLLEISENDIMQEKY